MRLLRPMLDQQLSVVFYDLTTVFTEKVRSQAMCAPLA